MDRRRKAGSVIPYFELGDVALFHGDAREILPALGLRADLVLTDIPYAPKTHDGARSLGRGERATAGLAGKQLVDFKSFDVPTLLEFFGVVGAHAARWVVSTVDIAHTSALVDHTPSSLRFVRRGVWVKTNPAPQLTGDRPAQGFEDIAVLHAASEKRLVWNGGGLALTLRVLDESDAHALRISRDVLEELLAGELLTHPPEPGGALEAALMRAVDLLDFDGEREDVPPLVLDLAGVRKSNYPTEKPIALGRQLVRLFSAPGDLVLDPACGSGVFLRAARQLGRTAIGIDVDERALEVAAKLLAEPPATDVAKPEELRELPVRKRSLLHERAGLPVEVAPSY